MDSSYVAEDNAIEVPNGPPTLRNDANHVSYGGVDHSKPSQQHSRVDDINIIHRENYYGHLKEEKTFIQSPIVDEINMRPRILHGGNVDANNIEVLEEKRDTFFPLSFIIHNTKPVGHQDLVGLIITMLLLGDFSLVLLTLLQLYSISLADDFLVLFFLPLGLILPFSAGINALFSHGARRSAGLARVYALWNITSFLNVG